MTDQVRKERFMILYEPVHLSFQRFCRARTRSAEDAKDLINETVLVAYQGIDRLRDDKAFLGFVFGIASRLLKKQYRRQRFWGLFDYEKSEAIEANTITPEQGLDVQFLYEALHKLPLKYQDAVVLHCISGFSLQEVAAIQKSSVSAVKVRVMRAKIRLKKLLQIVDEKPLQKETELRIKIIL
jgi:RNA polymerase sigma-70 factor, ECF subfamily